ncbi:MAG: formate dehydrogenase accessory sulfurtransferase FdhD [Oscillospiraceae bacterium]|nr:formate dehydrogenase accessory sulfurtransferase FdhD [Oscillospiraceae bacterium]
MMTIHDESKASGLPCAVPASTDHGALQLAVEHHIRVFLNARLAMQLVCTPEHLDELVVGRLYTEGLIESPEEILGLHICQKGLEAKVLLPVDSVSCLRREDAETVSSCCTDNRVLLAGANGELPHLSPIPWQEEQVRTLAEFALREAPLYQATQAVHSCALAQNGELLCLREDLGRHNALDKVIGYALLQGLDLTSYMLFTTGRLPTDMLRKVIRAGIPLLISKTYPTELSVSLAKGAGLTLVTVRKDGAILRWT